MNCYREDAGRRELTHRLSYERKCYKHVENSTYFSWMGILIYFSYTFIDFFPLMLRGKAGQITKHTTISMLCSDS